MEKRNTKINLLCIMSAFMLAMVMSLVMPSVRVSAAARISKKEATVQAGKSLKLKVKGTHDTVKWSSSNKKIAKVTQKGVVKAKKGGKVTIKAKVGGKTYKCKVTVLCKRHTFTTEVVAATKEQPGYKNLKCKVCGHEEKGEVVYYQPTAQQVSTELETMKTKYPEGTTWSKSKTYSWNFNGTVVTMSGCGAFAAEISDNIFGKQTPVVKHNDPSKLKAGDIIYVPNNDHYCICINPDLNAFVFAQGDGFEETGLVRWNCTISKEDIEELVKEGSYFLTRYQQ